MCNSNKDTNLYEILDLLVINQRDSDHKWTNSFGTYLATSSNYINLYMYINAEGKVKEH
jgi:hypothetical protein